MTRFYWTKETAFRGYTLRDSLGYARSIITSPNRHEFYGQVFTRDMPDSGPYKTRQEAANWVAGTLVRLELVPADSTFEPVPEIDRNVA